MFELDILRVSTLLQNGIMKSLGDIHVGLWALDRYEHKPVILLNAVGVRSSALGGAGLRVANGRAVCIVAFQAVTWSCDSACIEAGRVRTGWKRGRDRSCKQRS